MQRCLSSIQSSLDESWIWFRWQFPNRSGKKSQWSIRRKNLFENVRNCFILFILTILTYNNYVYKYIRQIVDYLENISTISSIFEQIFLTDCVLWFYQFSKYLVVGILLMIYFWNIKTINNPFFDKSWYPLLGIPYSRKKNRIMLIDVLNCQKVLPSFFTTVEFSHLCKSRHGSNHTKRVF